MLRSTGACRWSISTLQEMDVGQYVTQEDFEAGLKETDRSNAPAVDTVLSPQCDEFPTASCARRPALTPYALALQDPIPGECQTSPSAGRDAK